MAFTKSGVKDLLLVLGLCAAIGTALAVAGATVHNATQPNRVLPFGLDSYLSSSSVETLSYLKYALLIDKNVEVRLLLSHHVPIKPARIVPPSSTVHGAAKA